LTKFFFIRSDEQLCPHTVHFEAGQYSVIQANLNSVKLHCRSLLGMVFIIISEILQLTY